MIYLRGRISLITVRREVVWEDFPMTGYAIKPDRVLHKKNQWTDVRHGKLRRPVNELIQRIGEVWHYLGTFEAVSSEKLPCEAFRALPEQVRFQLRRGGH